MNIIEKIFDSDFENTLSTEYVIEISDITICAKFKAITQLSAFKISPHLHTACNHTYNHSVTIIYNLVSVTSNYPAHLDMTLRKFPMFYGVDVEVQKFNNYTKIHKFYNREL